MYGTSIKDHDRGMCRILSWLIAVTVGVFAERREWDGLLMRLLVYFFSNGHEHIFVLYTACLLTSLPAVCAQWIKAEKLQFVVYEQTTLDNRHNLVRLVNFYFAFPDALSQFLMLGSATYSIGDLCFACLTCLRCHAVTCVRSPL